MGYFIETSFFPEIISFGDELAELNATLHPQDVKKAASYLTNSFKRGKISEEVFQKLVETLLAFYIEQKFEQKILNKKNNLRNAFFISPRINING